MLRIFRLNRRVVDTRRLIHINKINEIDDPNYHKQPLDPHAIQLIKRYQQEIIYSSYLENNKKPLNIKERKKLYHEIQRQKYYDQLNDARTPEPSILIEKILPNIIENPKTHKQNEENSECETNIELSSVDSEGAEENQEKKRELAKSKLKIFTELGLRRSVIDFESKSDPDNWMEDYETYDEDDKSETPIDSRYGTPDPSAAITKVPCHGCGAMFQCADTSLPGYLPSELIRGQHHTILRTMTCQRCHFLKNYNTALKVQVNADEYINMLSNIKDERALAIVMVDLTDFPCSLWPNMVDIIGTRRPVIVVGNKVDLLPQDSGKYLEHIKNCLEQSLIDCGFTKANIKHIGLISARTKYGIESLITTLFDIWRKGDVYLLGNVNVGKSTLFNALLGSDYCKMRARDLIRRATSSEWPGTTLNMLKFPIAKPSGALICARVERLRKQEKSFKIDKEDRKFMVYTARTPNVTIMEHLDQTFEAPREEKHETEIELSNAPSRERYFKEKSTTFRYGNWFYDTPGVIQDDQVINMLTTEELLLTIPKSALWPRVFYMAPGHSLFLSGLGRIDYIAGAQSVRFAVFASNLLSTLVVKTDKADEVYQQCLGTEILNVPRGNEMRLKEWPGLMRCNEQISVSNYYESDKISVCDIVLSSAGWVSVNLPIVESAHFYAWTPNRKGIFVRKPSLLPYAATVYRGKRVAFSPLYKQKEPKQILN